MTKLEPLKSYAWTQGLRLKEQRSHQLGNAMSRGYVGIYLLRLEMRWVMSLKEKRSLIRPVLERLKARMPVSVARLDGLDAHDWEIIGITTIAADGLWVEQTLRQAGEFIAANGEYSLSDEFFEVQALE